MKNLFKGKIELKGEYTLKVYPEDISICDSKGNEIYFEDSDGDWNKSEYDSQGNEIYFEDSYGYWYKSEYDSQGNELYFENASGYWSKSEYDSQGNTVYFENSTGNIIDNRPKKVTIELTEDQLKKVKEILEEK